MGKTRSFARRHVSQLISVELELVCYPKAHEHTRHVPVIGRPQCPMTFPHRIVPGYLIFNILRVFVAEVYV